MKVDYPTTIGKVVEYSGGILITGNPERRISVITTDSRDLGSDNFFIPLVGEFFDGHDFIEPLANMKSIVGFLTHKSESLYIAEDYDISAIFCEDTQKAFGKIASIHRDNIDPIVVGVTGTNGKTTTKELLWSILSCKYNTLKNDKNYNNEVGVPYTLLGLKKDHKVAVIEMGMNHKGEIDRLSRITEPDIALITNIGEGHLEFLGSVKNVALAKIEIINGMKEGSIIFLNRDTKCYDILATSALDKGINVKRFGLSSSADIFPDSYRLFHDSIEIQYHNEIINIPLYGIHNLYNVIASIAVAEELGVDISLIKNALSDFRNVGMRSNVINRGYIVIDDTYNSNPLSSKFALKSVSEIFPERRKIAVFSDMKELGDSSKAYHIETGELVFKNGFDILCAWGLMAEDIVKGARDAGMEMGSAIFFTKKNELIDYILSSIDINDVILIKGSRSMKMEEVVDAVIH